MSVLVAFLLAFCIWVSLIRSPGITLLFLFVVWLAHSAPANAATLQQDYADKLSETMGVAATVSSVVFDNPKAVGSSHVRTRGEEVVARVITIAARTYNGPSHVWKNVIRHELCHLRVHKYTGSAVHNGKFHNQAWRRCAKRNDVNYTRSEMD